jgi:hypothetical protein
MNKLTFIFLILLVSCSKSTKQPEHITDSVTTESTLTTETANTEEDFLLFQGYINDNNIRIRSNPNTNSDILGLLNTGDFVSVINISNHKTTINNSNKHWFKITTNDNITGWIFSEYFDFIKNETNLSIFEKNINIENCTKISGIIVPNINNISFGINDDDPPWEPIKENYIRTIWDGVQVVLKNDIPANDDIKLIAINNNCEYIYNMDLQKIIPNQDSNKILGYYENIKFENKFWLSNGSDWQFRIISNTNSIFEQNISIGQETSLLFDKIDDTPFIINHLRYVNLHKQYTYRYKKDNTDILILYYSPDYGVYEPVLYLIPDNIENKDYIDIVISFNSEEIKGIYFLGRYAFNEIPRKEETAGVFDFIGVK